MPKEEIVNSYLDLISDHLSPVTRSIRNKLMLFSTIGIIIFFTGITPEESKFFGLEFPGLSEQFVTGFIGILILYFTVSFVTHSSLDRSKYVHLLDRFHKEKAKDLYCNYDKEIDFDEQMHNDEFKGITGYDIEKIPKQSSQGVSFRSVLDFHFPWVYGLCSVIFSIIHFLELSQ